MDSEVQPKKQRQYFIDWLRIGLIISVFFFHVGMIFRPENWHVNSKVTFEFLDPIMSWLHVWRMPLLFLVSGVGTYYALGYRTTKQYIKERITRLYIPLTVGFFTLVPLMVYVERIPKYASFLEYLPHMFDGGPYPVGNISWHHLWFIVYLLVISLLISPFINYTRGQHFNRLRERLIGITSKTMGLNWILPILILSQLVLRQYFPNSTHALFNDWAYFTYYVLFFISGFTLFTSDKLINALARQRRLYFYQTMVCTIAYFATIYLIENDTLRHYLYVVFSISLAWSCGLAAIGYSRIYFNKDHKLRKVLNEAIYPFYILHQPALIFIGYVVLQWDIAYGLQALLITVFSLVSIIITYWFIIKKFNVLRIAFGMKKKAPKKVLVVQSSFVNSQEVQLEPILANTTLIKRNQDEII